MVLMTESGSKENKLTGRETEVLRCLMRGMTSRGIADALGVTERTVKFHIGNIIAKMKVRNRTQAVAVAMARGVLH
jgi:DNA-binding NarL/FixJ family response regulator